MPRTIVLCLAFLLFALKINAQTLNLQFSTKPEINGEFENVYVLGVWVEDGSGKFVSSLLVYANRYKKYLKKWYAKSGNSTVNAVTGATTSAEQTHKIEWNCKKSDGTMAPNGKYKLCIELTSSNSEGPYNEVPFTIDNKAYKIKLANSSNFTNMTISFTPKTKGKK